ncbi:MAG: class I poly(R)-hydroxyalkanoic acid synthase, partial [Brevundimonas sp.]|nr:class I poly(R)-hydroxyalkanoic acid synthase [Brevundimonas sp.]
MAKRPSPPTAEAPPRAPRKAGRPTSAKPPRPRAARAAPPPEPAPPPPPSPEAEAPAAEAFAFAGADQRQMLETLSMNLAKAAMTAQSAIAEAALSQADRPAALSPDPFHVGPAMNSVMTSLASRPDKLFAAQADLFNRYMDLWATTTRRAAGEAPSAAAAPGGRGDKRFKDPAWSENPVFDVMRQSYLVTSDWMNGLVSSVEDVDPLTKRRAEFFTKLLTDAFSPSNFLASNPVALKALAESNGESLVKGMQNFAADMERGAGKLKISQADYGKFV